MHITIDYNRHMSLSYLNAKACATVSSTFVMLGVDYTLQYLAMITQFNDSEISTCMCDPTGLYQTDGFQMGWEIGELGER